MAALGKMGMSNPMAVAECFSDYLPAWCRAMGNVPASQEKADSYLGALNALSMRPDVSFRHFGNVVEAVMSYPEAPAQVRTAYIAMFSRMQSSDTTQWTAAVQSLSDSVRSALQALG